MQKSNKKIFEELSFAETEKLFFYSFFLDAECEDILGIENIPRIVNAAGLCICLEGDADIMIGSHIYYLNKGDMCVILPHTTLQAIRKSSDFRGYTCACTTDFLYSINMPSATPLMFLIKDNPCISLTETEQTELIGMCNFLEQHNARKEHPLRDEISRSLATATIYEVAGIYKRGRVIKERAFTRKNQYYFEFIELLHNNYATEREIAFYADKLCITSRYLSSICKDISGMTASECINHHLMMNIRLLLSTTDLTILQVSQELNFSNASFFSQFFKKHEGVSPKVYRERNSYRSDRHTIK